MTENQTIPSHKNCTVFVLFLIMWLSFGLSWQMSSRSVVGLRRLALFGNLCASKQRALGLQKYRLKMFLLTFFADYVVSGWICQLARVRFEEPRSSERGLRMGHAAVGKQLFRGRESRLHLRRRFSSAAYVQMCFLEIYCSFLRPFTHWIIGFEVKHKLTTQCLWVALLAHFHAPCKRSLQRLTFSSAN